MKWCDKNGAMMSLMARPATPSTWSIIEWIYYAIYSYDHAGKLVNDQY